MSRRDYVINIGTDSARGVGDWFYRLTHDEYGVRPRVLVVLGLALLAVCAAVIVWSEQASCRGITRETGRPTKFTGSCYVQTAEGWVPKDNWRVSEGSR